jgi:hypothetical protein
LLAGDWRIVVLALYPLNSLNVIQSTGGASSTRIQGYLHAPLIVDDQSKLRALITTLTRANSKLESSSSLPLPVFPFHTNKVHLPLILVPPADQFRHVFRHMLLAAMAPARAARPGLRKIAPYWYPYTTMAKGRWLDREILEIVSTEFRDRSIEYYVCVLFFFFVGR